MITIIKKLFTYILCILPWFASSIITPDLAFYNSLKLPFYTPPISFYAIAWLITYIGISISIYQINFICAIKTLKRYYKILLINYVFNQSFLIVFFLFNNLFLSFISCIVTFISTLFLYEETTFLNEKSTKYLNPYVLLSLFSTVLSLTIYLINSR